MRMQMLNLNLCQFYIQPGFYAKTEDTCFFRQNFSITIADCGNPTETVLHSDKMVCNYFA